MTFIPPTNYNPSTSPDIPTNTEQWLAYIYYLLSNGQVINTVLTKRIDLSAAQVKAAVPVLAITNGNADFDICVLRFKAFIQFNTVAFTSSKLTLIGGNLNKEIATTASGFLSSIADIEVFGTNSSQLQNAGWGKNVFIAPDNVSAVGDSDISVWITYILMPKTP